MGRHHPYRPTRHPPSPRPGIPDPVADDDPMCPACALLFPMPAVDGELCARCQERRAA